MSSWSDKTLWFPAPYSMRNRLGAQTPYPIQTLVSQPAQWVLGFIAFHSAYKYPSITSSPERQKTEREFHVT